MVFGIDVILAKHSDAVTDNSKAAEWSKWIRRDKLQGRQVATAGGTRVGTIDDVILDEAMRVIEPWPEAADSPPASSFTRQSDHHRGG